MPEASVGDRLERYAGLARDFDEKACVMRPRQLTGQERRLHVRATILEDHATRIDRRAEGTGEKFDKLAGSLFSFFRGTSLLFTATWPVRTSACRRCSPSATCTRRTSV